LPGGNSFGQGVAGVAFIEERLALKIGGLDKIAVENAKTADPCAREKRGGRGTDGSATYEDSAGSGKVLLAFFADAREKDLA
jgi:hypothetical protein